MSDTPRTNAERVIDAGHAMYHGAIVKKLKSGLDAANSKLDLYRIALEGIADWPHERDETTHIRMAALASHALNHLPRPASADSGENPPPESHRPDGVVAPAGNHS
jgi:hypothetical protein